MVHLFKCLGHDFCLDVESGTIIKVDKAAKKVIEDMLSPNANSGDFVHDLEYNEAKEEIDNLVSNGLLFSKGQKPPKTEYSGIVKALCLNVSHKCNLRCSYCFADGGSYSGERKNMSKEVARAAIDFLIKKSGSRKNLEVDFFGGEPLLNMDVVKDTIDYARFLEKQYNKNFRFTITTNGLLLTDEFIDYFNKEMHNVVISIDGRENVHNSVRKDINGRDSFLNTLKAAKRFKEARGNKSYYIRGTFTALNKDFSSDALVLNDYGFDQISLEPVALPDGHPLALSKKDLPQLLNQYEVLAEEYIKRRKGEKWFNFFHFSIDPSGGPCLKKRITGCGAGTEYLAIGPDGDIYPCHRFDGKSEYKIGNVLDNSFDQTLPKSFAGSNLYTKKHCNDCFCKYYCSGGCAANSIEFGGGIDKPYEIGCELMKKRVEAALAIYALEQE